MMLFVLDLFGFEIGVGEITALLAIKCVEGVSLATTSI
jgi:hypothetical protein